VGEGGDRVKSILDELRVRPDKRWGQNFLLDMTVLERQLKAARLSGGDTVLEVGAGLGVLTWELAARSRRVVSYEADPRLAEYLKEGLPGNVDLQVADALEEDWPPFDKMVANIPYSISSPLLFKLLETDFALAVLLMQKEFADRLAATPRTKAYGRLTVSTARLANVEILEVVPPTAFYPPPKVESALVLITPSKSFPIADKPLFDEMLRVVFSQRRKMLRNSLGGARDRLVPGVEEQVWNAFIGSLPSAEARPEELTPEELGWLSDRIVDLSKPS
jgi:16S rRNA (adenine1518-N6/adenine1519-N6)-dimethyltransferase